jgi:hypothetical protein
MSLPKDTRGEAAGSSFTKLETGQTELLILPGTITGYQYWRDGADGKAECVRSPEVFAEPIPDVRQRDVRDKDGNIIGKEPEKQQFYWAMPVYNYKTEAFELAQFTQAGIRNDLKAMNDNPKLGDPSGRYTVMVTKTGEGFQTKYKVDANPMTDEDKAQVAEIVAKYNASPMDVAGTLFGKTEAVTETPAPTATAAPAPAPEAAQAAPATAEATAAPAEPQAAPAPTPVQPAA